MSEIALIIEDDEDLSEIFGQALSAANYEIEIIRDGAIAQERLKEVLPVVVVLDMHLPHVSGNTLLKQIRADERLKKTRVVVATADAQMGESLRGEADLVLIKPITFTQLRDLTSRLHPIK
jgi:two-component system cell cycle response regulator DivK